MSSSPLKYPLSSAGVVASSPSGHKMGASTTGANKENTSVNIASVPPRFPLSKTAAGLTSPVPYPLSSSANLTSSALGSQQHQLRSQRNDIPQSQQSVNPVAIGPSVQDPVSSKTLIWATTVDPTESMDKFRDFLLHFQYRHRLIFDAQQQNLPVPTDFSDSDTQPYYRRVFRQRLEDGVQILNLDALNLKAYPATQSLYAQLIRYPQEIVLHVLDFVTTTVFCELFADVEGVGADTVAFKVRPFNLGKSINLRDLNPHDIDKLVSLRGFVVRTSNPIPELKQAAFKCDTCGEFQLVNVENGRVNEPKICSNPACASKDIQLVHSRCQFYDRQIVRIQETPDSVPDGQTPHTVSVVVYDELVDVTKPGDRVEVTGVYKAMPIRLNPRQRITRAIFKTYIDALHIKSTDKKRIGASVMGELRGDDVRIEQQQSERVETMSDDLLAKIERLSMQPDLYERLAKSLAPSIYARLDAKKACLLQLFGGSNKSLAKTESQKYRGNIHILLCGDPATSKSQLLQYVHRLSPRGIYTSGKGSSAVGLTAYVTRDPDSRQIVLESGALVLSDGGICCIDEFDKMSDSTRSVLHEAMEQQTVSIAKAGIITTLNARTCILAAANPIGSRWNHSLTVPQNLNLPPSLLSRFDIVYLMLDSVTAEEDTLLARHIASLYLADDQRQPLEHIVDMELFAAYISFARQNIHPRMDDTCVELIAKSYVEFRQMTNMTATARQLEAIIRLSEAHAKMRLSQVVEESDVIEAVRLIKAALQTSAIDPETGLLDMNKLTSTMTARERESEREVKPIVVDLLNTLRRTGQKSIPVTELWTMAESKSRKTMNLSAEVKQRILREIVEDHPMFLVNGDQVNLAA